MGSETQPRSGVLAGGNWIIDQVKLIDVYPQQEQLANISGQSQGTGGSPFNLLVDLAKLGADFPLAAAGLVGADETGETILSICRDHGIDTQALNQTNAAPTSYTDVMTVTSTGKRTFFHNRGANAIWDGESLDFETSGAAHFHVGYLLLLDALDAEDPEYGTQAAKLMARASAAGMTTSFDVVSEDSDRFNRVVSPVLPHTDYAILNEIEAGKTAGIAIRRADGSFDSEAARQACRALIEGGVRQRVVIHFPEGAYCLDKSGAEFWQSSLQLPDDFIKGAAGAGDAFCAGCLLGFLRGVDVTSSLRYGVCAAGLSLRHPTCTEGVSTLAEAEALGASLGFRPSIS